MKQYKNLLLVLVFFCFTVFSFAQKQGEYQDPRDGKKYKVLMIEGKIWMAQNLAYIPENGRYLAYRNKKSNIEKYGLLYDWETAQQACPQGWRLPTDMELIEFFLPYGKISYTGSHESYYEIFGEYDPHKTDKTYDAIKTDKTINIPIFKNKNKFYTIRTMLWSSKIEDDRAYSIFWRKIDKSIEYNSVHFSSYPIKWYGFCRCVKE